MLFLIRREAGDVQKCMQGRIPAEVWWVGYWTVASEG